MTRRFVGGISRDMLRTTFRDWFGVQDNHADLLVALFQAGGAYLSSKDLARQICSHRPGNMPALWSKIHELRQAMEAESVDRADAGGFALTEIGMEECRKALRATAALLAAEDPLLPPIPGEYEFEVGAAEG